jgi:hypothetical protein
VRSNYLGNSSLEIGMLLASDAEYQLYFIYLILGKDFVKNPSEGLLILLDIIICPVKRSQQ